MREHSGLLTDLYELTMAAGYLQTRFEACATFELFVRHLPPHRNYLVAAGLQQALEFLEKVHFTADEIAYLRRHPVFRNIRDEYGLRRLGLWIATLRVDQCHRCPGGGRHYRCSRKEAGSPVSPSARGDRR